MKDIMDKLSLDQQITLDDIPELDLYMDQVIQLFEKKYDDAKRNEDEKILTKTMINNYAKGKLFFPIKNKKYSKEHIILISLIYQLKGALSINDIKKTLDGINHRIMEDQLDIDEFYNRFLQIIGKNAEGFKEDVLRKEEVVEQAVQTMSSGKDDELEQILLIASLVNMSNYYRRTAEKLVDQLAKKE
ncbi:uncharacterized protein DUF1836 [Cytobacillus horneckiae]|uniref:DUF1836 domain-containing protein n=1 Tax=Cytobacillus horneckiae TaxID=549687 RepID=UPI0019D1F351|nr:DUF1836 domain-containing protein [Cytobacillus horneckiae]MBN6885998.1 DUF1836 domain-containing protein [Cytobacillus horneckiae]